MRLSVIGRRDRLGRTLVDDIEATEKATAAGTRLHLRLAIDYSARDAIANAAAASSLDGSASASRREWAAAAVSRPQSPMWTC